jgi:hypothetical protein
MIWLGGRRLEKIFFKRIITTFVIASFALLQSCATTGQAFMHGTDFCNAGEKGLLYFRIEYGSVVREIDASKPVIRRLDPTNTASPWLSTGGKDTTCIHTSGYNTVMPIQETMTVEWQPVGGERRKVTIPIKNFFGAST